MKFQLKRNDIILMLTAILVSGIALWLLMKNPEGNKVEIASKNGNETYDLLVDQTIIIGDENENVIEIRDGAVSMVKADCRDQICVKHKPIHLVGETIICLPNDVYITVKSGKKKEIDN